MDAEELDVDAARDALGGDDELLMIVVRAFLDESPQLLQAIVDAVEEEDAEQIRLAAHALKGCVRYFGQTAAYRRAYELETSAAAGDVPTSKTIVGPLGDATAALQKALGPLLNADQEGS